ncbi:MAG: type II toxin-antitoxin system RelE/ParE family toxin [Cytophagales bacterium]|nr:type II toxin-antitoxin system RelE/ParE family toxin [Armatimonadota bacterium]
MSKGAIFSPESLDDISEILDYLDENASPVVALRFYEAVQKSVASIEEMPGIGALRDFNRPVLQGMRMFVISEFSNHLIFYREASETIEIVRVLDGRRNLPALF